MGYSVSTTARKASAGTTALRFALAAALAVVLAAVVSGNALGATPLSQSTPIAWDQVKRDCQDPEARDLDPGQVLWHFVLSGTLAEFGTLSAQFQEKGSVQSTAAASGGSIHFVLVTKFPETLVAAETDVDGSRLDLAYTCDLPISDGFPTPTPSSKPTPKPTAAPTPKPTAKPTAAPTSKPTAEPTAAPTAKPTNAPTAAPTSAPTATATSEPTPEPLDVPTPFPTNDPTPTPAPQTVQPTVEPTDEPTTEPTAVAEATSSPEPAVAVAATTQPPSSNTSLDALPLAALLLILLVTISTVGIVLRRDSRRRPLTRVLG